MIDRETAIQWAKDAGFRDNFGYFLAKPEEIQALITRAQNEAYEQAINACDHYKSMEPEDMALQCQKHIRSLKTHPIR